MSNSGSTPLKNVNYEQLCQKMADGVVAVNAYMEVFNTKKASAKVMASRLLKRTDVSERLQFLQAENSRLQGLSRADKRLILLKIANSAKYDADKIRAIQEDNRMTGDYKFDKGDNKPVVNITFGAKSGD